MGGRARRDGWGRPLPNWGRVVSVAEVEVHAVPLLVGGVRQRAVGGSVAEEGDAVGCQLDGHGLLFRRPGPDAVVGVGGLVAVGDHVLVPLARLA